MSDSVQIDSPGASRGDGSTTSRHSRPSRRQRLGLDRAAQVVSQAKSSEVAGILGNDDAVLIMAPDANDVPVAERAGPAAERWAGSAAAAIGGVEVGEADAPAKSGQEQEGNSSARPVSHEGVGETVGPDDAEAFRLSGDDVQALSLRYARGMSGAVGKLSVAVPVRIRDEIERLETFLWRRHRQTLIRDRFFTRALKRMPDVEAWRTEARAVQLRREPRVQMSPRVSVEVMDDLFDVAKTPPPVPYGALLVAAVEQELARLRGGALI